MSSDPTERPQDRADVARFYAAASPSFVFNMAARQVAAAQGSSLSENARALALLNMATNDSLVASFWTKYHYNLWRPETAIFEGNLDGNARTDADPTYVPYILTPCFPSYPSNHGSASNSAAEVLKRVYGAGGHEAVGRSRDHEEIGRHDLADVIPQKRASRRTAVLPRQARDRKEKTRSMRITPSLFEAHLKSPTKCWLRSECLPNLQIDGRGLSGFPSFRGKGHSRLRGESARAQATGASQPAGRLAEQCHPELW